MQKISCFGLLGLLFIFSCKKESDISSKDKFITKSKPGFVTLPKSIDQLCYDVDDPAEGKINHVLFDVMKAYVSSYISSPNVRATLKNELVDKENRHALLSKLIENDKPVFLNFLNTGSSTVVKSCADLSCINQYFQYFNYDYEVLVTFYNRPNPNLVLGSSVIFALGTDFYHDDDIYEDVIPCILLEYIDGTYALSELGLSEDAAYKSTFPIYIFNFNGIGDMVDNNYPKYGKSAHVVDSVITDKASYFNMNVTGLKANHRFESSKYSEFLIHGFLNYCCENGWGPNYSYSERDPVYQVHKNKIGQHIAANWNIWSYYNESSYGEEYWWTKFAVYEWDWWASGKNTDIRIANSNSTMGWQIQSKFKHEWYLAQPVFKNDVMFTYSGQTIYLATSNGYIYLTRK